MQQADVEKFSKNPKDENIQELFMVQMIVNFLQNFFFFQAEDGIRYLTVTGVQTCALPITFTTLRRGLRQLVDALAGRVDAARVHLNSAVLGVDRVADGWSVRGSDDTQMFDAVIVATPAWAAAEMLSSADGELSGALAEIPYSSSITVNLVYDGEELDPLPPGFGFLVPAVEGRGMLACTFIHRKFPGRTAAGKTVLRVFLGGVRNAELLRESDEELEQRVRGELFQILQISAVPELVEIQRWPRAMAQYAVGHKERQRRIQERLRALRGLYLAGNAYDGIGISDCIRLGRAAARGIVGGAARDGAARRVEADFLRE